MNIIRACVCDVEAILFQCKLLHREEGSNAKWLKNENEMKCSMFEVVASIYKKNVRERGREKEKGCK